MASPYRAPLHGVDMRSTRYTKTCLIELSATKYLGFLKEKSASTAVLGGKELFSRLIKLKIPGSKFNESSNGLISAETWHMLAYI